VVRDVQDAAVTAQLLALKKTPGLGSRIDITLTLIRIGIFFGDNTLITENLAKAEKSVAPALGICGLTHTGQTHRRGRRLGPPESSQGVPWGTCRLHSAVCICR